MKEQMSDSADLLAAESILKNGLESYMQTRHNNDMQYQYFKTDTTVPVSKSTVEEYSGVYTRIRDHIRQVRTFHVQGKKYLYLNLFCPLTKGLPKGIGYKVWLKAYDGGECFWQMIVCLSDRTIVSAGHNGIG